MTYELPKRTHLVHKPIEYRNLSAAARKESRISDPNKFLWQLKYDGCNLIVVVDRGTGYAFSRTGEPVKAVDHIVNSLSRIPGRSLVWFGEAYSHEHEHSLINGAFRTDAPAPWLKFIAFDAVPLEAFEEGVCHTPYEARLNLLDNILASYAPAHVHKAFTFNPERLSSVEDVIKRMRANHVYELDGYVAKRRDGIWRAGAGKGGEFIKVKNHLSLDLRCVGLVEGKGKFAGMVGAVQVEYNGQVIGVGGGKLTDEERRFYWTHRCKDRGGLLGCIVEIHALAGSAHGKLREPRFIRVRRDKTEPEA